MHSPDENPGYHQLRLSIGIMEFKISVVSQKRPYPETRHCSKDLLTRIVNTWNSLSELVISSNSTNCFKNRLDKFWINQYLLFDILGAQTEACVGLRPNSLALLRIMFSMVLVSSMMYVNRE